MGAPTVTNTGAIDLLMKVGILLVALMFAPPANAQSTNPPAEQRTVYIEAAHLVLPWLD